MSVLKTLYPASSTVALTITLASLATDSNLLAGRESTAVDNTSNLDLDHLLSGLIVAGTSPTGGRIEVWVYAPRSLASGTPTYPTVIDGTDSDEAMPSANVKSAALRLAAVILVDAVSDRAYDFAPVSIASLYGGVMPPFWGAFVVQSSGAALNAAGHALQYERIQAQTV